MSEREHTDTKKQRQKHTRRRQTDKHTQTPFQAFSPGSAMSAAVLARRNALMEYTPAVTNPNPKQETPQNKRDSKLERAPGTERQAAGTCSRHSCTPCSKTSSGGKNKGLPARFSPHRVCKSPSSAGRDVIRLFPTRSVRSCVASLP